jgi:hypothetical protein
MNNLKTWAHGLFAAMIGGAASSLSGALALPGTFNLTHDGLVNMAKLGTLPALINAFAYLKQSPLPTSSVTVSTTVETKQ